MATFAFSYDIIIVLDKKNKYGLRKTYFQTYKNLYIDTFLHVFQAEKKQRCIQNPVKHLRWGAFCEKIASSFQPLTKVSS